MNYGNCHEHIFDWIYIFAINDYLLWRLHFLYRLIIYYHCHTNIKKQILTETRGRDRNWDRLTTSNQKKKKITKIRSRRGPEFPTYLTWQEGHRCNTFMLLIVVTSPSSLVPEFSVSWVTVSFCSYFAPTFIFLPVCVSHRLAICLLSVLCPSFCRLVPTGFSLMRLSSSDGFPT